MAKVIKKYSLFINLIIFSYLLPSSSSALDIIRDTELEQYTAEIMSILLSSTNYETEELEVYFVKSDQINAFVTGGKNIFINTELIIEADDYREYAAVLAHELAHIQGGHIFNTSIELNNLSDKALPIYLLGIIGIIAGSAETGLAGVMVGQASVSDGFTYYSRTQEAAADQAAVKILCQNGIDGNYLISFLNKLQRMEFNKNSEKKNYRSTHPLTENRITWINSSLRNGTSCNFKIDHVMQKRFELLKAKLHGFTHPYSETIAIYSTNNDIDLYAKAVASYFQGEHLVSIENLNELIENDPNNPFYRELIGEIYFANSNFEEAAYYQKTAIGKLKNENDLYYMMIGNYLLSIDDIEKTKEGIEFLKKSIHINPKNSYSWYLLAKAYAKNNEIAKANYATAERYFLIGERLLSYDFALKAVKNVEEYSPEWYRSSDLIEILKKEVSTKKD